jgi:hypothetical protein
MRISNESVSHVLNAKLVSGDMSVDRSIQINERRWKKSSQRSQYRWELSF